MNALEVIAHPTKISALALTGSVSILNPNNGYLLGIGRDTICSRIAPLQGALKARQGHS